MSPLEKRTARDDDDVDKRRSKTVAGCGCRVETGTYTWGLNLCNAARSLERPKGRPMPVECRAVLRYGTRLSLCVVCLYLICASVNLLRFSAVRTFTIQLSSESTLQTYLEYLACRDQTPPLLPHLYYVDYYP